MNNIINFPASVSPSDFQEFTDLLNTPDSIFDVIYPQIKNELAKLLISKEYLEAINEFKQASNYEETCQEILKLIETIKADTFLSNNKREFVSTLFGSFIENDVINLNKASKVSVQLLCENARIPKYSHPTDAGADIYAISDMTIAAHTYGVQVQTGLKVAIEPGWQLSIRPRSGMSAKTTLRISNAPGTIDSGYRGEVLIIFDNTGDKDIQFKTGDRIAQFILEKVYIADYTQVENVDDIGEDRGGGIGHTGK